MRLHEITKPIFFLSTSSKNPTGGKISAQASVYPLGSLLEHRLEHRRPADRLPRSNSLYLQVSPDRSAEHVYEVEPIGQIDRLHTGWLQRLQGANVENDGEIDQLVRGYWSGDAIPELRDEPWEHRTLVVKIIARCNDTGVISSR